MSRFRLSSGLAVLSLDEWAAGTRGRPAEKQAAPVTR
jgi:hypothetical protein